MRTILAAALLVLTAAGLAEGREQQGDWFYRPPSALSVARVDYVFRDLEHSRFIGRCERGTPNFFLAGGDYALGTSKFILVVDGNSWELPAFRGRHSHFLGVVDPGPASSILQAKRLITFRAGKWQRQFSPNPVLQQFGRDCSS